jgi:hypothetical protein
MALASAPALLASFFQKAYAGTTASDPIGVFNDALRLELLEADFYAKMVAPANATIFSAQTAANQTAIQQLKKHEDAHVTLLTAVVRGLGGTPVSGVMVNPLAFPATWDLQLQAAQLLEDTGVRAYKGRTGDLQDLPDMTVANVGTVSPLALLLRIHSVEARHAAHIRTMRDQTPWITGGGNLDSQPAYTGSTPESNTVQSGLTLTTASIITTGTTYSQADVVASFDEPLSAAEVFDRSRAGGLL